MKTLFYLWLIACMYALFALVLIEIVTLFTGDFKKFNKFLFNEIKNILFFIPWKEKPVE